MFGVLVLSCALSLGAAQPSGTVSGIVTDATNSPIPGVRITVTMGTFERTTVTREDGRYTFASLPVGRYSLKAELAGFETVRMEVLSDAGRMTEATFTLQAGCLSEVDYVDRGFVPSLRHPATTVLHIRIVSSQGHNPCPLTLYCVCRDYVAVVERILKSGRTDVASTRIRVLHEGPDLPSMSSLAYAPGAEYVAFLEWHAGMARFLPWSGSLYLFRVRDGRVDFQRTDAPGISDGMTVEQFTAAVRGLISSGARR